MISGSLIFLVLLLLALFIWQSNLRAKELAYACAKQLCLAENVQLLDDSVVGFKLSCKNFALIRHYRFDYYSNQHMRLQGFIELSRHQIISQKLSIGREKSIESTVNDYAKSAKVLDFSQHKQLKSKNDA